MIPQFIDESVNHYKTRTGSPTWNAALWELVRAGLLVKLKEQSYLEEQLKVDK
ncbi:hypothetical protein [Paenibacillus illinoisensis]|uniref:hypothetical protein n=1 Tax=Paenibacillus illinoisensis TaxID=59845 RepID=UPI00301E0101